MTRVKKITMLLVLLTVLLAACSSNTHTFRAVEQDWKINLTAKQSASATKTYIFELKYEGEHLDNMKEKMIRYTITTPQGTFDYEQPLSVVGTIKQSDFFSCDDCAILQEDDTITVNLYYDDADHLFTLKAK